MRRAALVGWAARLGCCWLPVQSCRVAMLLSAEEARILYGDGSFGGPYRADEAVMDELFAACLADVMQLLANLN